MRCFNNTATSELFSFIIVLMIATSSISVLSFWAVPYMNEKKAQARLESSLLQLDALVETIEDALSESVGEDDAAGMISSGKILNYALGSEGSIEYDNMSERFVFYTSAFDSGSPAGPFFVYDAWGFDPHNSSDPQDQSFYILIRDSIGTEYDFVLKEIDGTLLEEKNVPNIPLSLETEITFTNSLSGAVKIEIFLNDATGPGIKDLAGVVWIFDVASLTYETTSSSGLHRVILENGGLVSAGPSGSGYLYKEPAYWSTELLNGSKLLAFRIVQIIKDDNYDATSISGTSTNPIKFHIKSNDSYVDSTDNMTRLPIFMFFNIKIYGDSQTVQAWWNYYQYKLGFLEIQDFSGEKLLQLFLFLELGRSTVYDYFSLNFAQCTIGMEVTG